MYNFEVDQLVKEMDEILGEGSNNNNSRTPNAPKEELEN